MASDRYIADCYVSAHLFQDMDCLLYTSSSVQSADRILVLENGRIDAFDTHENLLKNNDIYQEIYNSQLEGGGDFDQPA